MLFTGSSIKCQFLAFYGPIKNATSYSSITYSLGVGTFLKTKNKDVKVVLADPQVIYIYHTVNNV